MGGVSVSQWRNAFRAEVEQPFRLAFLMRDKAYDVLVQPAGIRSVSMYQSVIYPGSHTQGKVDNSRAPRFVGIFEAAAVSAERA